MEGSIRAQSTETATPDRGGGVTADKVPLLGAEKLPTRDRGSTLKQPPNCEATILSHQRVADTTALVTSISTMAKAAYTAQFIPWLVEDLLALDVPLNRTFRRLLRLPPTHPNALLYIGTADGGLGLPRLSDQINLRKWSILRRLQERGGLSA